MSARDRRCPGQPQGDDEEDDGQGRRTGRGRRRGRGRGRPADRWRIRRCSPTSRTSVASATSGAPRTETGAAEDEERGSEDEGHRRGPRLRPLAAPITMVWGLLGRGPAALAPAHRARGRRALGVRHPQGLVQGRRAPGCTVAAKSRASPRRPPRRPRRGSRSRLVRARAAAPGDLARERLAVADGEEHVPATVHHERRDRELGQALAPARLAVELGEHDAHLVGHLDRRLRARRAVPDALGGRACGGGIVAEGLRAGGGELRHGGAVGPVGHRAREHPPHRRLVVVGQVLVGPARCDGPRPGEGERRERVRVVERGDLGDHPAHADARQVRRPVVQPAGERRGVGREVPQVYAGASGSTVVDAPESRRS